MNPYLKYIQQLEEQFLSAKTLPLGGFDSCPRKTLPPDAPKVLIFSPHPDDECITGLLPLRLMRETGMRVINVPVTYGSNKERQAARAEELRAACGYLGWTNYPRDDFQTLEKADVVRILKSERPAAICMPHAKDWNTRHIATHFLVMDALGGMPEEFFCAVIESEVWGAMEDPNLLVAGDARTVADLIAALSFHSGEVRRNPYHISTPFWMRDNVRRGGELVGGQGSEAPDFTFATLYRLRRWRNGKLFQCLEKGRMVGVNDNLKELF